jgi:hypothetical protein
MRRRRIMVKLARNRRAQAFARPVIGQHPRAAAIGDDDPSHFLFHARLAPPLDFQQSIILYIVCHRGESTALTCLKCIGESSVSRLAGRVPCV